MATLTYLEIVARLNAGNIVFLDCEGKPTLVDHVDDIPVDLTKCGFVERSLSEFTVVGAPTDGQVPTYVASTGKIAWNSIVSGSTWGTITGTLSNQTDLQSALNLKANLASPTFTGTPLTPTAALGTNTTQIASTAFVRSEVAALVNSAPSTLDTLNELAAALGNDPNFATTVTNSLATKGTINATDGTIPYRLNSTTFADSPITTNAFNQTGLQITSNLAGSGVTLGVTSTGTNEGLTIAPKGNANLSLQAGLNNVLLNTVFAIVSNARATMSGGVELGWAAGGSASAVADTALVRHAAAVVRVSVGNGTGGGHLLVGASTDTFAVADAQVAIFSQSATRPSLKLRAVSGTPASQSIFESYDASNVRQLYLRSDGQFGTDGASYTFNSAFIAKIQFSLGNGSASIISKGTNGLDLATGTGGDIRLFFAYDAGGNSVTFANDGAAHILAQRSGTNAQTFRLYNTYTDANNYERGYIRWNANVLEFGAEGNGTGITRSSSFGALGTENRINGTGIRFYPLGSATAAWLMTSSGNIVAVSDNTYDIGASGGTSPKYIYLTGWLGIRAGATSTGNLLQSQSSGVLTLMDYSAASFGRLQFGGTTSSFPAIKRSGTGFKFVLADDSNIAPINYAVVSSTKTSSYSVLTTDSGTVFDNQGVTGNANFLLPAAAKGLIYTFIVSDTDGLTIVADTGHTIRVANTATVSGGTVDSTTIGNVITIVAISSTEWYATSVIGTWTIT